LTHCTPGDHAGVKLTRPKENMMSEAVAESKTWIAHMGHCLPAAIMTAKHDFYMERDGKDKGRIARKTCWHNWDGKLGNIDDGVLLPVRRELPEIVTRAFAGMQTWEVHNAGKS